MINVEANPDIGEAYLKEEGCQRSTNDQETPGSYVVGSRPTSVDFKLKQGRLIFPEQHHATPNNEENPAINMTDGHGREQPLTNENFAQSLEEKMDVDDSPPPAKPSPTTIQGSPPQTTPTQAPPTETTPSRMTPPNRITTQPSILVTQSCPPKPKLSKTEREAMRLERERARTEAKIKREEERVKREQERLKKEQEKRERQLKKEQETKERMEKKAKEELEKKEKREKKEAERRAREEERKKKEEERKKAELEKEQAREEKVRKEQEKRKRFMGFFSRKPKEEINKTTRDIQENSFLTPFSVKTDMTLAATPRPPLTNTEEFDRLFFEQRFEVSSNNCLESFRGWASKRERTQTEPLDDDLIEIKPTDVSEKRCYKLIQFHTNHRPAYFGTWRKKSRRLNPRNPFQKDEGVLDYEVDSDDEWEEEDPGESISNSEGEDGDDGEDGDGEDGDDDDGFFVPHGYLSDGEGDNDDGPIAHDPTGTIDDTNESKRKKMAAKEKAWEMEFARKCQPLKPVKVGCVWSRLTVCEAGVGECELSKDEEFLRQFAAVALVDLPLSVETKKESKEMECGNTGTGSEFMKMPVPEEAMPDLIRLMHGSSTGVSRLVKTFRMHWGAKRLQQSTTTDQSEKDTHTPPLDSVTRSPRQSSPPLLNPKTNFKSPNQTAEFENASGISKRQLEKKIHEVAIKEAHPPSHKPQWYVHDSILQKYHIDVTTITPLVPLASPQMKTVSERAKVVSPLTPCGTGAAVSGNCGKGNKKGAKRKTDGIPTVKSLFQNHKKSPENTDKCGPPKPKRVKLELHVDTTQPKETRPEKRGPGSGHTQAAKRLCLDKGQSNTSVIVLDSENCSSSDTKENEYHVSLNEGKSKFSLVNALKDLTSTGVTK